MCLANIANLYHNDFSHIWKTYEVPRKLGMACNVEIGSVLNYNYHAFFMLRSVYHSTVILSLI